MNLFTDAVAQIEDAYDELNHKLGWRFLYSPSRTLSSNVPIFFAGLNPGGNSYEPPKASVEEGNAYLVEGWKDVHHHDKLQRQVCLLYEKVANKLGTVNRDILMDNSLVTNFCPFRSSDWKSLPNRKKSEEFSRKLWFHLLTHIVHPSVFICLTHKTFDEFRNLLLQLGYVEQQSVSKLTGWKDTTYTKTYLVRDNHDVLMLRLPHLSRFSIIGDKPKYSAAVEDFTDAIARQISTYPLN
ncbi:hypothetical protein NIES2100_23460 [Calothrix sp. NIES-2100]|uniref:hypothetical protein n=1 Tax=Calothrix sp. NIES-2100 TaxID=1954172 RepID=UPI000B5E0DD1|nr:hypothetical protein NIES2100_23460 [Calothrix sp. NIES-2100]